MFGRIVGLIVGAAIAVTGYGILKPQPFSKYFDFNKLSLGPFAEYKTIVCGLIIVLGVAVALAALQRPSGGRKKKSGPVMFAPSEPEPAHAAPAPAAEAHHDDHGHDDHGHDDHGHRDHGHGDHGHDDHHADHGHDDHGHGAHHDDHGHGHDDHGHGHDDHGHGHDAHAHEPAH
jgi:hypothetical protein